jgi:hypothetical protein
MMLNSLALRGRSLFTISSTATLPSGLRPLASHAITSAHQILICVLEEPSIRDSMVGVPLYLHTVIAFAVVFLIKMSSRWTGIGVSIDAEAKTKPLIEGVISLFRSCRAGKGHILYAMADGFERLLRRNMKNGENGNAASKGGYASLDAAVAARQNGGADGSYAPQAQASQHQGQDYSSRPPAEIYPSSSHSNTPSLLHPHASPTPYTPTGTSSQQQQRPPNGSAGFDPYALSPHSQPTSAGTFGGWQTEDDMLWSMGMGYDLLATAPDVNAHGMGAFVGWPGGSIDGGSGAGPGYSQGL